jgi:hypothetical protein
VITRTPLEDVLVGASDDWLDLAFVYSLHMPLAEDPDEIRRLALTTLREALDEGLLQAGDLDEAGFEPWTCGPSEAYRRIETEWMRRRPVLMSESAELPWLGPTEAGRQIAREVVERESTPH